MSEQPNERAKRVMQIEIFIKNLNFGAANDGFALIFVENTSKNAFLALAFLVLFCHQKSTNNKFFRRKPSKNFNLV